MMIEMGETVVDSAAEKRATETSQRLDPSTCVVHAEVGDEIWQFLKRAHGSSRLKRRLNGGYDEDKDHEWVFHFIDIIYVGTMYQISHLFEHCGDDPVVYVLAFSYFVIMFSTRSAFDVYMCISGAQGVPLICAFLLYGLGVLLMTLNVSVVAADNEGREHASATSELNPMTEQDGAVGNKGCVLSYDYNIAFAASFFITRFTLVVMYNLYFFVFHETNTIGTAPCWGIAADNKTLLYSSDFTEAEVQDVIHRAARRSRSLDYDEEPIPWPSSRYIRRVEEVTKDSAVMDHMTSVGLLKVIPILISCFAVGFLFIKRDWLDPLIVLAVVAVIEFVLDFFPPYVLRAVDWKSLSVDNHFVEHRLSLFVMLALGEIVLNLSIQEHHRGSLVAYIFIVSSFIIVFALGLQFFEKLQAHREDEGVHPLSVQALSPVHTWLICIISFLLVVVAYGLVVMYKKQKDTGFEYIVQQRMVLTCIGLVIILTVVTKILTKKYYRKRLHVFAWLEKYYVGDEHEDLHSNVAAAEVDTTGKLKPRDTRRTLPLTVLRLTIATFLLLFSILEQYIGIFLLAVIVALPTLIEIQIELTHFNAKFRAARLALRGSAVVVHETVRAPAMEDISPQVSIEQL